MALNGVRVVELAGLAPGPFCGQVLADFGATVVRVDKVSGGHAAHNFDTLATGKKSIAVDLKAADGRDIIRRLAKQADVLIEPFRPGVMEKLGLGPDVLLQDNHRLIYARLTGFGQKGEYALRAGHDINYLALTGVLSQLCPDPTSIPHPPINLLADFAGGGMMCVVGILLALQYRSMSNMGQVVDCSMVAGVSYLSTFLFQGRDRGMINNDPAYVGKSILDGGAPFYRCYRCKDGEFISVGAIEPAFYKILLYSLGYSDADNLVDKQHDMESWPDVHNRLEETFVQKNRDEWSFLFKKDACVAPVLRMDEAPLHPHNIHINAFAHDAAQDPNPAPVLSGTPGRREGRVPDPGEHGVEILEGVGFTKDAIEELIARKIVAKL